MPPAAACSSGTPAPSHVLRALGLSPELLDGALRIGLGKFTTSEEIDQASEILSQAVYLVRQICRQGFDNFKV